MLRSLFLYIRQKPKGVRNQIALAISSVFTGMVALVWLLGQVDQIGSVTKGEDFVTVPEHQMPFSGLFDQLKNQVASVKEAMSTTTATSSVETPQVKTEDSSASTMMLSPETIASSSWSVTETGTTSTTSTSTMPLATTTEAATNTTVSTTPSYRVIQIATSSQTVATTTPPL